MGMNLKAFPCKGTLLLGLAFLLVTLWHAVFRDASGFLLSLLFFVCFPTYTLICLVYALFIWSGIAIQRAMIAAVFLGLFFPTVSFGGWIRDRILISELADYQNWIERTVAQEKEQSTSFSKSFDLPANFPKLLHLGRTNISCKPDNEVTALFVTQDSSALGHSGYLYCSDDNLAEFKAQHPKMGFKRVAPHWYLWGA